LARPASRGRAALVKPYCGLGVNFAPVGANMAARLAPIGFFGLFLTNVRRRFKKIVKDM
jgi:hypothetical protein